MQQGDGFLSRGEGEREREREGEDRRERQRETIESVKAGGGKERVREKSYQ